MKTSLTKEQQELLRERINIDELNKGFLNSLYPGVEAYEIKNGHLRCVDPAEYEAKLIQQQNKKPQTFEEAFWKLLEKI